MITTQDSILSEKRSLEAIYQRRQVDIVFTTSPITPLQQSYKPGEIIQVVLQKSRHMIPIGDIQLCFRPVINYGTSPGLFTTLAEKMMLSVTASDPTDFLSLQSATVENNQLLSQTNLSQTRPRNIVQQYINMLSNVKSKDLLQSGFPTASLISSAGNGSRNTGFQENSITHPYVTTGANLSGSRFESNVFPRALFEQSIIYNAQFSAYVAKGAADNKTFTATPTLTQNFYFQPRVSANADAQLDENVVTGQYPLLPLQITASIAVYKEQQSRFAHYRQRYLTHMVTAIPNVLLLNATTVAQTYEVFQGAKDGTFSGQQKMIYSQPINGPMGGAYAAGNKGVALMGGSATPSSIGASTARYVGCELSNASASYAPIEQYTNTQVSFKSLGAEFNPEMGGIDLMCMDSTQMVIQFGVNTAQQALSAYLQPSFFFGSGAANSTGATAAQNAAFLAACSLGDITFTLEDVCLRIPFYSYSDPTAYSIVREITYQPQSYPSFRFNVDPIQGNGQMFSRLNIGGSSLITCVWFFIIPAGKTVPTTTCSAADCMVNFESLNPPGISDLRCVASLDSYYVEMSDVYVQINNKRYNTNAIPISNPQYAAYLALQSNLETTFGKHLNVPFHHWLKNRCAFVININPFASRDMIISDSQLIAGLSLDFTSRLANSKMYGETNLDIAGKFQLLTIAQTQQSMVACSYVKLA